MESTNFETINAFLRVCVCLRPFFILHKKTNRAALAKQQYLNASMLALSMHFITIAGQHEFLPISIFSFRYIVVMDFWAIDVAFFAFVFIIEECWRKQPAVPHWYGCNYTKNQLILAGFVRFFLRSVQCAMYVKKYLFPSQHSPAHFIIWMLEAVDDINHTAWMQSIFNKSLQNPFISIDRQSFITQLHRIFMNEPPGDK